MNQFENKGFICNNALLLFDIDNDGHNEFILGNIKGSISIYKFLRENPVYSCGNLGSITCLVASVVEKHPILVAPSAEGMCHFFHIKKQKSLSPFLSLKVPCNITSGLITKNDKNGNCEIVFGSLDRNLYFYTFQVDSSDLTRSTLIMTKKIFCDKQIYSLSFHQEKIIAGYQVGGYGVFVEDHFSEPVQSTDQKTDIPVFVQGNVEFGDFSKAMLSVNIEGKLDIHKPLENSLWSIDLEEEIVGVHVAKFDGIENSICVCTWDGITHIIDKDKNMVRFNLRDRVCSFIVGTYSISESEKRLCIFYATFNDKVVMFSDILMKSIPSHTILEMVMNKAPQDIQDRLNSLDSTSKVELIQKLLYQQ
jgi:hypothetical protein